MGHEEKRGQMGRTQVAKGGHTEETREAIAMSRRNFLTLGLEALGALAALEIVGAGLLFLKPRSLEGQFGGVITAGPVSDFSPGSVTEFPEGRFFLIRTEDGGFLAVYRRCTHLGCSVSWEPTAGEFVCPCHGSHFDTVGDVQNPPAPRALDIFPITIEDDTVKVDTSKPQSRDTFSPDQLVYT